MYSTLGPAVHLDLDFSVPCSYYLQGAGGIIFSYHSPLNNLGIKQVALIFLEGGDTLKNKVHQGKKKKNMLGLYASIGLRFLPSLEETFSYE